MEISNIVIRSILVLLLLRGSSLVGEAHDVDSINAAVGGHVVEVESSSHVLVLDASNFTQIVKQHPFIVVEFYAPWCGHCKNLAPLYDKAAALLKKGADAHDNPPIILAKLNVNDEHNRALAIAHGTRGVPTLIIFQNGGTTERVYKGPMSDAAGIVSYLKRQAGPASAEITSAEEGGRLIAASEFLVVGIFPDPSSSNDELAGFISLATELQSDYEFKHTLDYTFLPHTAPGAPLLTNLTIPTIRVFKKFDEGFHDLHLHDFSGAEGLKKFLDGVSIPRVVQFSKDPVQEEYLAKIFSDHPNDTKVFLFLDANNANAPDDQEVKSAYAELAKEHKGKGLWFLAADTKDGQEALEYFGAQHDRLPSIIILDHNEKKYTLEKARAADMAAWLKDYLDGKVPDESSYE